MKKTRGACQRLNLPPPPPPPLAPHILFTKATRKRALNSLYYTRNSYSTPFPKTPRADQAARARGAVSWRRRAVVDAELKHVERPACRPATGAEVEEGGEGGGAGAQERGCDPLPALLPLCQALLLLCLSPLQLRAGGEPRSGAFQQHLQRLLPLALCRTRTCRLVLQLSLVRRLPGANVGQAQLAAPDRERARRKRTFRLR